jgi:hypothetical protein
VPRRSGTTRVPWFRVRPLLWRVFSVSWQKCAGAVMAVWCMAASDTGGRCRDAVCPVAAKRNLCEGSRTERNALHCMGALKRRYVTKMGAVKEYHYATIKGLPYKEYRREEWKRLFRSKSRRSASLTEAEAEHIHQLHRGGVSQAEIATRLGTTRYRVQVCLGVR